MTVLSPPEGHFDASDYEAHESSFADITERMFQKFESVVPLHEIVGIVRDAREQLRGSPLGALPELTERLAMERLSGRIAPAVTTVD